MRVSEPWNTYRFVLWITVQLAIDGYCVKGEKIKQTTDVDTSTDTDYQTVNLQALNGTISWGT